MKIFGGGKKKSGKSPRKTRKEKKAARFAGLTAEQVKKKKRTIRLRRLMIVLAILAVLATAVAVWIKVYVKAPEIPTDLERGGKDLLVADDMEDGDAIHITDTSRKEDYYMFLACATDEDETRTDAMMMVAFDKKNGKLNILSIPRDTISNTKRTGAAKKLNAAYGVKQNINQTIAEITQLTGLPVDRYLVVNFDGIKQIVDAIGGVDYYVPRRMKYSDSSQNLYIDLQEGMQTLDGEHVVQLLRWRKNNGGGGYPEGDIGRIKTQQDFLKEMAKQMMQAKNISKAKSIAEAVFSNVTTDFKIGEMIWLANEGLSMDSSNFGTDILPGYDKNIGLSFYIPYEQGILDLVNEKYNPYRGEIRDLNIVPEGSVQSSRTGGSSDRNNSSRSSGSSSSGSGSSGSSSSGSGSSGSSSSGSGSGSSGSDTPSGNTSNNQNPSSGSTTPDEEQPDASTGGSETETPSPTTPDGDESGGSGQAGHIDPEA